MNQPYETQERPGLVISYQLGKTKIYKGAMVGVDSAGYLYMMGEMEGLTFVGVANVSVDNSPGDCGFKSVNVVKSGSFVYEYEGEEPPSQSLIGLVAYAISPIQVTCDAEMYGPVGHVVSIERTYSGKKGVRIRIDQHVC